MDLETLRKLLAKMSMSGTTPVEVLVDEGYLDDEGLDLREVRAQIHRLEYGPDKKLVLVCGGE